jgi:filamentous hemagglutinin
VVGASITDNGNILLPSGALQLEATAGDVVIGNTSASQIDVGGTAKTFYDQVEYTDGGQVSLTADLGSVAVGAGSTVNVSAQAQGGNAGSVTISAPNGSFTLNGTLSGNEGAGGSGRNLPT